MTHVHFISDFLEIGNLNFLDIDQPAQHFKPLFLSRLARKWALMMLPVSLSASGISAAVARA